VIDLSRKRSLRISPMGKLYEKNRSLQIDGRNAYLSGESMDTCPYPIGSGNNRMQWLAGWLDTRTWEERGSLFRRHGVLDDRPR